MYVEYIYTYIFLILLIARPTVFISKCSRVLKRKNLVLKCAPPSYNFNRCPFIVSRDVSKSIRKDHEPHGPEF